MTKYPRRSFHALPGPATRPVVKIGRCEKIEKPHQVLEEPPGRSSQILLNLKTESGPSTVADSFFEHARPYRTAPQQFRPQRYAAVLIFSTRVRSALHSSSSVFCLLSVPIHRFSQAVLKINNNIITKILFGSIDGCLGVSYIPCPRRLKYRLDIAAHDFFDAVQQFQQIIAAAAGDVEILSSGLWSFASKQVGLNHVLNIGKVPRLSTVAIDHRALAGNYRCGKLRDHGGVI